MNPVNAVSQQPSAGALRTDAPNGAPSDRLRRTATQLEGVFVEQLFKAMRETVPSDGELHSGGEEMFSSLFDQELAGRAPEQWQDGLGQAIMRALRPAGAPPESR
jgi:flagellar protein FlgJ